MAKIAYGKREDIQQAIDNGVIPENTTIITNETEPELLFYDKNKKLKTIDEKSRFYSLIEVSQWLEKYDCGGLFFSVYDKGKWTPYVINHENEMIPFAELYDDTPLKEQIELLIKENESQNIQISEIFKILEEIEQVQTGKQFIFKGSYSETNLAEEIKNNPPELGDVYQVLNCNTYGVNYGDLFYATGEIANEEEKEWYESNGEPILSSSSQSIISNYKFIQIGNGCSLWDAINDLLLEIHDNFAIIQDENGGFYAGNVGKIKSGAVTIGNNASSHYGTEKSVIIGANTSVNSHGDAIIIGGHSDCDDNAIVVGIGSNAHSGNSIVIGHDSDSGDGGVAMGHNAETSGGVVLGNEATTLYHNPIENYDFGIPAIQIGKGNNPNLYTAQLYNYQLLSTENPSATSEKWLTDVGRLSTLETNDKTNIVTAINEINSNKQPKDFIITGTVTGNLGTGGIDVSDISCTYEEARAAFDGGRNVKCLFYVPELSTYTEFRYKAHSEYAIMFECMFRDYNYLPVFMTDGTWDWSFDKAYADKVFCNDVAEYAGFYLQTEFHEETGNRNLTDAIVENRHSIEALETQIGDINTALETALNGGDS